MIAQVTAAILAVGQDLAPKTDFWSTSLGGVLRDLMTAIGIIVVLATILKAVSQITTGKVGGAVKIALGGFVVAAILFSPTLINDFITAAGALVQTVLNTFNEILTNNQS